MPTHSNARVYIYTHANVKELFFYYVIQINICIGKCLYICLCLSLSHENGLSDKKENIKKFVYIQSTHEILQFFVYVYLLVILFYFMIVFPLIRICMCVYTYRTSSYHIIYIFLIRKIFTSHIPFNHTYLLEKI